jgi:hypothetical protein
VVLEAPEPLPGAQHRVLQRILGVVNRAEHAVAVRLQLAAPRLDEAAKSILVTTPRGIEQCLLVLGGAGRG